MSLPEREGNQPPLLAGDNGTCAASRSENDLLSLIEQARAAQQANPQKHDVQLALVAVSASPKKAA